MATSFARAAPAQVTRPPDTTMAVSQAVRSWAVSPGEIRGVVLDAATGKGLSDAQVFVERTRRGAITDSSGRFVIRDVPAGSHTLVVRKIAYASTSVNVELDPETGWAVRITLPRRGIPICGLDVCAGACHSIAVYVWDVLTGRPPTSPVALRVSQDTMVYWDQGQADGNARALRLSAAYGEGAFTVEVVASGYAAWRRSDVWVERSECGVTVGQQLQVWLLPVGSIPKGQP